MRDVAVRVRALALAKEGAVGTATNATDAGLALFTDGTALAAIHRVAVQLDADSVAFGVRLGALAGTRARRAHATDLAGLPARATVVRRGVQVDASSLTQREAGLALDTPSGRPGRRCSEPGRARDRRAGRTGGVRGVRGVRGIGLAPVIGGIIFAAAAEPRAHRDHQGSGKPADPIEGGFGTPRACYFFAHTQS